MSFRGRDDSVDREWRGHRHCHASDISPSHYTLEEYVWRPALDSWAAARWTHLVKGRSYWQFTFDSEDRAGTGEGRVGSLPWKVSSEVVREYGNAGGCDGDCDAL